MYGNLAHSTVPNPESMKTLAVLLSLVTIAQFPLGAASAQVQPIPLDTVEVDVGSRASAAGSRAVEVIHSAEIRNTPAINIADVLRWAFGIELMPRSPALVDVAIRGSSFEQVLVLVDGVRMRDAQTGHFNLNLAVPLEQVERIEVLRGPASSLYGSDAMGGVINIVTRKGGEGASFSAARGSFATTDAAFSIRRGISGIDADLAASYTSSDGHRAGTDYEIAQLRLAASAPLAGQPLRVEAAYASRDFGADGFYGAYPSFESTGTTTASARWSFISSATTSVEPLLAFRRNTDDFILFRGNPAAYRNRHTTDQLSAEVIGRTALGIVDAAVGLHALRDEIESSALGNRSEWTGAGSIELATGEVTGSSVSAGLRIDQPPTGGVVLSPSISASLRLAPAAQVRGSVGRSFRGPTWTERYYRDPANVGNPDLIPERAWSGEVGVNLTPIQTVRFGAAIFGRNATNLIDWAKESPIDAQWVTRNVESADFRGVEAELLAPDLLGFRLGIRGQWLSLSSSSTEGFLSKYALRPQVESLGVTLDRSFGRVAGTVRAARERRVEDSAHLLVDARIAVDLARLRVWADVRNLSDEAYDDISLNPAAGRSLWLGLEWRESR